MANLGDISKIKLPNGNVVNIKDATARAQALIAANQSTQYNYSSVSSMSGTSGFTSTYYFDRPIPTGTYRLVCTNVRTDTSKQCQFQVVGADASKQCSNLAPTISTANYVTYEFTTTFDLYGIKVYCNTPIEITNLAIIPKALYDAGFTEYQPYALPNTKITPELIELVDSGAKNLIPINSGTATQRYQIDVTLPAGEYMLYVGGLTSTDIDSSTCQIIAMTSPTGTVVSPYVMATRETGKYYSFTLTNTCNVVYVYASDSYAHSSGDTVTFSNLMICTKAAWDVSQKYVPYAMNNAELTNKKQDKASVKYSNVTIGTTYENPTGMFWTVPAKSIVRLSASIHGDGTNYPDGIFITFSTSAAYTNPENVLAKYEPTGNELNLAISTIYPRPADTSYTLWLYVKGKASAEYRITYTMDILDTFD